MNPRRDRRPRLLFAATPPPATPTPLSSLPSELTLACLRQIVSAIKGAGQGATPGQDLTGAALRTEIGLEELLQGMRDRYSQKMLTRERDIRGDVQAYWQACMLGATPESRLMADADGNHGMAAASAAGVEREAGGAGGAGEAGGAG